MSPVRSKKSEISADSQNANRTSNGMSDYTLTVGLEIHVELATRTKMFCNSRNDSNEKRPNVNICPVCMGYPGTLPVINQEAVGKVLRLGVALDGEIADYTEFDRKNYFYPDIPKGYQISQYKNPLVSGGELMGVKLTRIHLEEDTAKSIHMEKGEMRVEANISLAPRSLGGVGVGKLGTKVEVKNLNSFKVVEKAIKFEMERQIEMLEKGEEVVQETRGWDENKEITFSQRLKESAHDYRYFPDPDLPALIIGEISEFDEKVLIASLPELPWQKRERYKRDFGLKDGDIEIYVRQPEWGRLLEEVT